MIAAFSSAHDLFEQRASGMWADEQKTKCLACATRSSRGKNSPQPERDLYHSRLLLAAPTQKKGVSLPFEDPLPEKGECVNDESSLL